MNIKEITLLTTTEYRTYKHLIPVVKKNWFLRDTKRHGAIVSWFDAAVHVAPIEHELYYVRPALRVQDIEAAPGDSIEIFAYNWTVLRNENNEALVLCEDVVTYRKYGNYDKWEGSNIYKWLNAWLKKRLSFTKPESFIRHKKMNYIGMRYKESDFLSFWLTQILLFVPLGIVVSVLAWNLRDCAAPAAFYNIARGIAVAAGLINLLDLALIVFSPHQDTTLLHVLNILLLAGTLVFGFWSTSIFNMVVLCAMMPIWAVNYKYFKKIKYYS